MDYQDTRGHLFYQDPWLVAQTAIYRYFEPLLWFAKFVGSFRNRVRMMMQQKKPRGAKVHAGHDALAELERLETFLMVSGPLSGTHARVLQDVQRLKSEMLALGERTTIEGVRVTTSQWRRWHAKIAVEMDSEAAEQFGISLEPQAIFPAAA